MIKLYANNLGWVMGRKGTGEILYTKSKAGAKPFPGEWDEKLIEIARYIEGQGHHLDKVTCRER